MTGTDLRILFVHQNFPAQFVHLAKALKERGHDIFVLTWKDNQRPCPYPAMRYAFELPKASGVAQSFIKNAERGVSAARAAQTLRTKHGYIPDVVFGHFGWGETLFLREIWPEARHLSYAEFFYRTTGADVGFDTEFRAHDLSARMRTLMQQPLIRQAMGTCDKAVAPTAWQAGLMPDEYAPKMHVIHDGVDTDRLRPDPQARFQVPGGGPLLRAGDEVITFVNRNLEPYRGFHIFMRALPQVLRARPRAHVVLVGGEEAGYGSLPPGGGSWKQKILAELGDSFDPRRVHFVGKLPYAHYCDLIRVGRVHAYLTYPFVLSWSMLEAMSMGAHVIGSDTAPVRELITHGQTGQLVDFFDVGAWSAALIAALANPDEYDPLRRNARAHIVANYDLVRVCLPRMVDFVEAP